jgi:hypothetical protein
VADDLYLRYQLDIAESVEAGVEEAADDSGGFVLGDDGGAGDDGSGLKVAAVVDRDLYELARIRVKNRPAARWLG